MAIITLTAVDSSVAFSDASVPQRLRDAWSYTATFAQAAARARGNADAGSEGYFHAVTQEFQELGWNITDARTLGDGPPADAMAPAAIISSILQPWLPGPQQAQLAGVLDAFQRPDIPAANLLDFIWKKASASAGKTGMAMGPLTVVGGTPNITMIYFGFDFAANSWRSLFEDGDVSPAVSARKLEMNLNMVIYDSFADDLIAKLSAGKQEHIASAPIDL